MMRVLLSTDSHMAKLYPIIEEDRIWRENVIALYFITSKHMPLDGQEAYRVRERGLKLLLSI